MSLADRDNEQRIQELLEASLESSLSLDEICANDPELLPELRERLQRLRRMEAQLDALFPSSNDALGDHRHRAIDFSKNLPRIPGYELRGVLGQGGMGVVFDAWHLKLNRSVAIKMLLTGAYASDLERKRLTREAQSVAALCHPNIVTVHDVGEFDGCPFFTMERIDGQNLADRIARRPQSVSWSTELISTLADAVQAAHQAGIVHRDLKPGNVLLTSKGTPKITDFGLARRFLDEPSLTLNGARAGTPSYMAPEQAMGKASEFCPAVDIYALGAMLYELLTGRPPFQGESAAEIERHVIQDEPILPTRLNAKIPRDLETICLKCLSKEPAKRYDSAAKLAEDLRRFLNGQPILARPVSQLERWVRGIRRNPVVAGLILTSTLLVGVAVGTALREWHRAVVQKAELAQWSDRLRFVVQFEQEGRFDEARAILRQIPDSQSPALRDAIDRAQNDLNLVEQLVSIRLGRGAYVPGGGIDYERSSRQYEELFRQAGLGSLDNDPVEVAARLKNSPIRPALIAALDDWAACALKEPRGWILAIARHLDPDPWRDRVRDQNQWANTTHMESLAAEVDVEKQPVTVLVAMGTRWRRLGGNPTAFLEKVQRTYPNDFWVNFELGHLYGDVDPDAAIGYGRAAIAVRPNASVAHYNLGIQLSKKGQDNEAIHHFRRASEIDPGHSIARFHLSSLLATQGRVDEAMKHARNAWELEPGNSLYRRRIEELLVIQGKSDEALAVRRDALAKDSSFHDDWNGYAELSLFLGREDEYRQACESMLRQFGEQTDPHVCERMGRACLLLATEGQQLKTATLLVDRAVNADPATYAEWAHPYFMLAKALAEYRNQRFDEAISILKGDAGSVLRPSPALILAMAQFRQGDELVAKATLVDAVHSFDWRAAQATTTEAWIYHIFRREAEALIVPSASLVRQGNGLPDDNLDRLALMGLCEFNDLSFAMARMYRDAFAADPALADNLSRGYRLKAARVAARCSAGEGADASALSDAERGAWRRQALDWLTADFNSWRALLETDPAFNSDQVRQAMTQWQTEPDLAPIRDEVPLKNYPVTERDECLALWADVQTLRTRAPVAH